MTNFANNLAAIDGDGVLLDYHHGYARAWEKAFGEKLKELVPSAYHAHHRFSTRPLTDAEYDRFRTNGFDEEIWASMPALPGAVAATRLLSSAGMNLVCVSALPSQYAQARLKNLQDLGMPIAEVIATGIPCGVRNPKAKVLQRLRPALFVDDFLPFHEAVPEETFKALVDTQAFDSPNNAHYPHITVNGRYPDLLSAVEAFLRFRLKTS